MNKKRILYFIQLPPPVHGVTMMNNISYLEAKNNNKIEIDLIEIYYSSNIKDLGNFGIRKLIKILTYIYKLIKKLILFKPDYVYMSIMPWGVGFYRDLIFVFFIKFFNARPIFHIHGKGISDNINKNKMMHYIYNYCFSNSNIIHLSPYLLETEVSRFKFNNSLGWALPNGIKDENLQKKISSNKTEAIKLVFLSNLQASKGIFDFLKLGMLCFEKKIDVKLNIIGGYRNEKSKQIIENFIEINNLKNSIIFHGPKFGKEKHLILNYSDILVHPTYNDAFPLVIIEGKLNGLVILSTTQGAIPEMVVNDIDGFVVNEGDIKTMFSKILILSEDRDKLNEMKISSRRSFDENFSSEIYRKKYNKLINEML